eukprot:PhF_6_TR6029/c0_g1_i2/m.8696
MNRLHNFDDVINYLSQRYKVPLTDRHNAPTYSSIDGISSEATYFKRATVNILVQFQNELLTHVGKDDRNQSTRFKSSNGVKQFEDQQPDQHLQRLHHGHRFPHAAPPHGGPSSITSPPHHFTSNSMEYSNSDVSSDMAYTYEESPISHPHSHQRVKQSTGGDRETDVYSYDYTEDQSWADRSQCQCPDCNGVRSPKHGHRRGDRNKHKDDDDTTYPSPMSSPRGEPQRKKDTNGSVLDDHGSVHIQTKQEPQYLKLVASNSGSTMHPSHNTQQQHWVVPEQQPHPQQRYPQPKYIHPLTGKPLPEGPPLPKRRNSQSPSSRRVPPPPSTRPALNSFQDLMHRLDSPPIPIRSSQPHHHPSPETNMRTPPGPQHDNKSLVMNNYSHSPPVETYHDHTPPIKSPSYSLSYSPVYHGQQEVRPYTPPVMNRMSRYHASPLTDTNLRPPLRYYDPMNPSMVTTDTQAVPPPPPPPPPVTPTPDAPKGILKPIAQMSSDDSDAASSTHSKEKKKKSSSHSSSSKDKDKDKKKKEKHTSSKHHSSKEKDKHHSKSSSSSDKKKKESSREDAHDRDAKKEHHSSSSKSEDQHHHHHHRTGSSHHSSEKKTSSPEKKKSHSHTHHDKKK